MRLTLRTLLAYLDDTLEPSQAKLIGQKVAESDTAQELIARIKDVTRQRRLTAPAPTGGKLEADIIAGYLDNVLPAEQLAEVEQLCLGSDIHLAELAACHQILTLVLGEPALVPPTAKQRMYGLVKGPEAIPFRKPAAARREHEELMPELKETDETLRLGLPALRAQGSWTNRLILLGGALAVAALLVIAIVQILQFDHISMGPQAAPTQQAKAENDGKPKPATQPVPETKPATVAAPQATTTAVSSVAKGDKNDANNVKPKVEAPNVPPVPAVEDVALTAPNDARFPVGNFERTKTGDASILLQFDPEKRQWQRVDAKKSEVVSGRSLLSLPGYKSVVALKNGVRLTLWGNVRELWPSPPVFESLVQLHHADPFDADLTLRRGRIVLANTRPDKEARVRVRFDNPTKPDEKQTWDLTLEPRDTEVALERFGRLAGGEPFYKDRNDKMNKGPIADVALVVLRGRARLKTDELTVPLEAPPKRALILWNSVTGMGNPIPFPDVPEWARTPLPPLPAPGEKEKLQLAQRRADFYRARDILSGALSAKVDRVDVALANALKSADPSERMLVVRCFGALDELDSLMDALTDEAHPEVRLTSIEEIKQWITYSRDHEYRLYDVLKARYKLGEADNIMQLLHGFSAQDLTKKEPYETLIDYLTNANPAIRELSATYLYTLIPEGRGINYNAYRDSRDRERAQHEWTRLLERLIEGGQIPRRPMKQQ